MSNWDAFSPYSVGKFYPIYESTKVFLCVQDRAVLEGGGNGG